MSADYSFMCFEWDFTGLHRARTNEVLSLTSRVCYVCTVQYCMACYCMLMRPAGTCSSMNAFQLGTRHNARA